MKKHIFSAALLAAFAFCSCVNETLEPTGTPEKGKSIIFEGEFTTSTKVQFEDAEDGIHKLTWSQGDAIGIFTYNGATTNENMKATLHDEAIGNSKGVFVPEQVVVVIPPAEEGGEPTEDIIDIEYPQAGSDAEDFLIYYPYNKNMKINADDFMLHSEVAHDQIQDKIGDRKVCANGLATAIATVQPGSNKATFSLTHKLAYLCVKATSSEFSGYQLHAVHMFDKNGTAAFAGKFAIDPESDQLTVTTGTETPSVRVDVKNHNFNESPEKNELYLAVLPGDFSTADIWFEVTFINANGATKNIPFEFDKTCKFPAGSLTTIDLGEISSSMVSVPWYCIDEERDLLKRCAYGSQNTYYVQRPTEDEGSTEVTIDCKARGDFSLVKEPKYYAILSSSGNGCASQSARKFLSIDGTRDVAAMTSYVNGGEFKEIGTDYEFSVYVISLATNKDGRWGTVAIFDEDKNILWSYMIAGYLPGDEPQDMDYGEFKLIDRFLGQGVGSRLGETVGDLDANMPAYFQWGRKDPFVWSNGNAKMYTARYEKFADIADAASNPCARVMTGSDCWYEGPVRFDLWGGENKTESDWYDANAKGHKTVYDPCPAGYRVPDAKVFNTVVSGAEIWEVKTALGWQIAENVKEDTPFVGSEKPYSGTANSVVAYKLPDGKYDYWPYLGHLKADAGKAYNTRSSVSPLTNNNFTLIMDTWSNSSMPSHISGGKPFAVMMEYGYWGNNKTSHAADFDMAMNMAFPVRCQKID